MLPSSEHARAGRLRSLLVECSPVIEELTRKVCPSCTEVCCRQKHGAFTAGDRAYLAALGENLPASDPKRPAEGLCEFLGAAGCSKPRWQRAWKCTWYFCEPLLAALQEIPPKQARNLSSTLAEMGRLHAEWQGGDHAETTGQ